MYPARRAFQLLTALAVLSACGDSDPVDVGDITVADFVGSWTASSHVFTNNSDASESLDLIAGGGETRITVLSNGNARIWFDFGTVSDEWDAQLTVSGATVTSTPAEASRETRMWSFTLVGDVLTLTDASSAFDFTLAGGTPVAATEVVTFVPN